ncbi:MAG: lipoprotein signal peptidase, partial [Clostridia bacterium]|nr:lipoprotein signal peptidase [Clostridia bacterium]
DQVTKFVALSSLQLGEPVAVMPYLNWTLAFNYGAAFSFLADMGGWQRWFFVSLAVGMSAFMLWWLNRLPKALTWETVSLNLVLGGAIGNLIDRVWQGKVTDFIDFYLGSWHYATFNIADMAITIGAIALVINELFAKKPQTTP